MFLALWPDRHHRISRAPRPSRHADSFFQDVADFVGHLRNCIRPLHFQRNLRRALFLTRFKSHISRLYMPISSGAGLGCLVLGFILKISDGPTAVYFAGLLGAIAAICFAKDSRVPMWIMRSIFLAAACIAIFIAININYINQHAGIGIIELTLDQGTETLPPMFCGNVGIPILGACRDLQSARGFLANRFAGAAALPRPMRNSSVAMRLRSTPPPTLPSPCLTAIFPITVISRGMSPTSPTPFSATPACWLSAAAVDAISSQPSISARNPSSALK